MNGARSDASTSTDDVKGRPLCLFYFTHPFGVLSPEPPTIAAAPPHIARAFLNMEPVSPFTGWDPSSDDIYNTCSSTSENAPSAHFDVLTVARTRNCTFELSAPRRDSLASSLFSTDLWFNSSSSCRSTEYPRRLFPYNKMLPPLRLPTPHDSPNLDIYDELWPRKCLNPEKFSLPPIELPTGDMKLVETKKCVRDVLLDANVSSDPLSLNDSNEPYEVPVNTRLRQRRSLGCGVNKPRRTARAADLRRLLSKLMQRALAEGVSCGGGGTSPALHDALATIREAWPEPRSLRDRCGGAERRQQQEMERAHPDASPGLMRRRYSVPETIMRKYRLAQQKSDSEENTPPTGHSVITTSPAPWESANRFVRRDRELMRKSALLRRMWARGDCRSCCCCDDATSRETRSLDGSRSELRPLSTGYASIGWSAPKRQRLDSRDTRASDEMLRAAMRNSFDRERGPRHTCIPQNHTDSNTENSIEPFTESERDTGHVKRHHSPRLSSSDTSTDKHKSVSTNYTCPTPQTHIDRHDHNHSHTQSTFSMSVGTAKEMMETRPDGVTLANNQDGKPICENYIHDLLPYDKTLTVETMPDYDVLEIVVSETLDVDHAPVVKADISKSEKLSPNILSASPYTRKDTQNINIDEYVSNILVESLNSLTDQLEHMNASIGSARKISIVEKEIKVKLQNTGVNTIVHLSPTSNNQIIFGNEELCNEEGRREACNNNTLIIREEALSLESNNNVKSADAITCPCDSFDVHHDNVNKAVLQQIQKLFQDELHTLAPGKYSSVNIPEISHLEISDVDVFIDNATRDAERCPVEQDSRQYEVISGVGAGNYYPDVGDNPVVPRFSALPHTDSMEVNTSSSDDADLIGSECTSLVDSLDDPNSPRSVLMRRGYNDRRGELVRSGIDVLDLLPENVNSENAPQPRDKPESFFIGIKDNECDCDKENVNVADRMPEKIKQRLYQRHRKREQRMECARRTRSSQQCRDPDRVREKVSSAGRSRRDVERDCMAIVNALINDVIAKYAQEEYKCMRIKHRPNRMLPSKSDENEANTKRTRRKEFEALNERVPFKTVKNSGVRLDSKEKRERHQIYGKLSLHPPSATDDRTAKRIYQKSEIHDGNKCIEILEILEYVNGSQSSPEILNSDENQNLLTKNKKSRIPVPISERHAQKSPGVENNRKGSVSNLRPPREANGDMSKLLGDRVLEVLVGQEHSAASRRVPVAASQEPRERANSLRFRQVFDIIPEERSSLSVDSGTDEMSHNRRASAPEIVEEYREPAECECDEAPPAPASFKFYSHKGVKVKAAEKEKLRVRRSSLSTNVEERRRVRGTHEERQERPSNATRAPIAFPHRYQKGSGPLCAGAHIPAPSHRLQVPRSRSCDRVVTQEVKDGNASGSPYDLYDNRIYKTNGKLKHRAFSVESDNLHNMSEFKEGGGVKGASSDSSECASGTICSLAPRWLRARRRRESAPAPPAPRRELAEPGAWSVTVAGSCRAALPADVEMRLRFPSHIDTDTEVCKCRHCSSCRCSRRATQLPPAPARSDPRLTLTMKKEALDSSILTSKSSRKPTEQLPHVETYRASRSKMKSSVKMRQGYSLHCWLPNNEETPIRARNGLSVLGCAIIPELKPRVPTMSERDLTRVYTPRHYLRS